MKYLLLIILAVVVFWLLKRNKTKVSPPARETEKPVQAMVRCAHCGVHLPRAEAVEADSAYFCSDEHRRLGHAPER
jgi:uncharacterized protein